MKSPAELRATLRRQWENASQREARLLDAKDQWPVVVPIGRPSPAMIRADLDGLKRHVEAWRKEAVGEVLWDSVRYRAATAPVDIPIQWKLRRPSEWVEAAADGAMRREFEMMARFVEQTDPMFHSALVRRRSLWRGKRVAEVVRAAQLAMELTPGCAGGRPLRTMSFEGADTKFFERHERLLTTLLDVRFDGEVSAIGLETFLGAWIEGDHWLLVVDLDGSLLPFEKQRVRSSELRDATLPATQVLIVENESCQHLLPRLNDAIALLGTGFDLSWAKGWQHEEARVAYWGDIDTWGLGFLAAARCAIGKLDPLMMTEQVYEQFQLFAVPEPVVAGRRPPEGLTPSEQDLYLRLLREQRGRLEQEFLPKEFVVAAISHWASAKAGS